LVASQWAAKFDAVAALLPMRKFLSPHLTLAKVWFAQNSTPSVEKTDQLIGQLQEYLEDSHNRRFLIDTLVLRSLFEQARGNIPVALAALQKSLVLAQPGGFIRVFLDFGPQLTTLLSQLKEDQALANYVKQISAEFSDKQRVNFGLQQGKLIEPLTNREFQILELLGERFSNKEIAEKLVVSPGTVKGHTIRIYQKLNVNGRRQAVDKAIKLGILTR
jgi:LuxR family maltose regulon positive regulatory protein